MRITSFTGSDGRAPGATTLPDPADFPDYARDGDPMTGNPPAVSVVVRACPVGDMTNFGLNMDRSMRRMTCGVSLGKT